MDQEPSKSAASGRVNAAYAQAFSNRELRLREIADWMRVQEVLSEENPKIRQVLDVLSSTVDRFLPDYKNLRLGEGKEAKLLIDRGNTTLEVRQLSDGERGVISLVLDLTRRLALANPEMDRPAEEAEAIVLIDELDLHLHPRWQRRIVANLTAAFPKCQFIATTHSPQVIGEVPQDRIQIIADHQVFSPEQSFGMDANRVLEEIMDTQPRTGEVQRLLERLSRAVSEERLDDAREDLRELTAILGEDDPEVLRTRTMLAFLEDEA
jgi:predicted ATP-binding protein involved in virulence